MADGISSDPFSNPMAMLYAQYSNPLFAMGALGGGMDPSTMMTLQPKIQMAQEMMQQGMSTAPTLSPWAGLSRLAGAIIGPQKLQAIGQQFTQQQNAPPTKEQQQMFDEFGTTVYGNVTNQDGSINHARALWESYPTRMKQIVMAGSSTQLATSFGAKTTLEPGTEVKAGMGGGTTSTSLASTTQGKLIQDFNNAPEGPGKDALGREINAMGTDQGVAIGVDPTTHRQYAYLIPGWAQAEAAKAGALPTTVKQGDIPTTPAQLGVTPPAPAAPTTAAPPPSVAGVSPTARTDTGAPAAATGAAPTAPAATPPPAPATAPAATPAPPAAPATAPPPAATAPAATTAPAAPTAGQNLYARLTQRYNLTGPSTDSKVVDPMLANIAQRESGFNGSNFAKANRPSTLNEDSTGIYQISQATWKEFGDPRYARAMDAPESVQTAVAKKIFAARGEEPWLGSNPNYKAAQAGQPAPATAPATTAPAGGGGAAGGATGPAAPDVATMLGGGVQVPGTTAEDVALQQSILQQAMPSAAEKPAAPAAGGATGGATGPAAPTAPAATGATGPAVTTAPAAPVTTAPAAAPTEPLDPHGVDPTNVAYTTSEPLRGINPAKITITPQSPYWPGPRGAGLPVGRDTSAQSTVDKTQAEFSHNFDQSTALQNQNQYRIAIKHALSVLNNATNDKSWQSGDALQARAEFQTAYNGLMGVLGSPFRVDDNMIASYDSFKKASQRLGLEYGSGIGTGTENIVDQSMVAVPRPGLQGQSARLLLSSMDQQAQRSTDLRDFQLNWQQDPRSHGLFVNSKDEFERLHPTVYYADKAVYNAVPEKNIRLFEDDLRAKRYSREDIEKTFDAQYGEGMAKFAEQQLAQGIYPQL